MYTPPLPKSWLVHSIVYNQPGGKDEWGVVTSTPITINRVRFDDGNMHTRNTVQNQVLANAVIFVCNTNSTNVPSEFIEDAKIEFNGTTYTIVKAVNAYYPDRDKIRHFELEVK